MSDYSEFLERYYREDILKLAGEYPDRKTLVIDFTRIEKYDIEVGERLLEYPDTVLEKLSKALQEYDIPVPEPLSKARVSIHNLPKNERISIHKIGSEQVNKLIAIEGRINKVGERKVKLLVGAFKCLHCESVTFVQQPEDGKFLEPYQCENDSCERKRAFRLSYSDSTTTNEQKLEIQELYESLKPGQPLRDLKAVVRGNDIPIPALGSQAIITGIVRVSRKEGSNLFDTYIEVLHIEAIEPEINLTISEAEKREFRELANSGNIFEKLISSTAPAVLGYSEIKLALLCAVVSGPNTIIGGSTFRGYLHIAIVGEPGTAKTLLAMYFRAVIPRAQYSAGRGSTVAGLTVAVNKEEGGYTAQAGALVLADKGLMIIDELDKLESEDIQALNTALESSFVKTDKATIHRQDNAREPIIALLNPKGIRFDDHEDISKQIKIPADTLSRFDLIFKIQDIPNPEKDRAIAEHIDKLWQRATGKHEQARADIPIDIDIETMRKYLAYAKTFEPVIPAGVGESIIQYYLSLRNSGDGTIQATARDLNALYRLTKAIAKLRLSNECTIEDVNSAIKIHKTSQGFIRDPITGKLDIDILYGMGKGQRDRIKAIREIIRDLQNSNGEKAFLDDIVTIAKNKNITEEQTADVLKHLKEQGDIIEVKEGFYRVG